MMPCRYAKGADWTTVKDMYNAHSHSRAPIEYISAHHLNGLVSAAVRGKAGKPHISQGAL